MFLFGNKNHEQDKAKPPEGAQTDVHAPTGDQALVNNGQPAPEFHPGPTASNTMGTTEHMGDAAAAPTASFGQVAEQVSSPSGTMPEAPTDTTTLGQPSSPNVVKIPVGDGSPSETTPGGMPSGLEAPSGSTTSEPAPALGTEPAPASITEPSPTIPALETSTPETTTVDAPTTPAAVNPVEAAPAPTTSEAPLAPTTDTGLGQPLASQETPSAPEAPTPMESAEPETPNPIMAPPPTASEAAPSPVAAPPASAEAPMSGVASPPETTPQPGAMASTPASTEQAPLYQEPNKPETPADSAIRPLGSGTSEVPQGPAQAEQPPGQLAA